MNTYGDRFRLTTFGESHGAAVGGVVDGCPSGIRLDIDAIYADLKRRSQGAPRNEADEVVFLSGIKDGITLGTPIAFYVKNGDARPEDYAALEHHFRPGHADYTYYMKYGLRDHRGGGRASARETVARVVAGAIAKQIIAPITINASVASAGKVPADDTYGGIISCQIDGVKAGVGEPVFDKLNARLASACMGIPSAIGFEMGAGFAAAEMAGSEYVDRWNADGSTKTNHCGGVQGGIANGMPIIFRVAFHPIVTLPQPVECLTDDGRLETITVGGRHDRSQVHRLPVIVESMAALCLINYLI